MIVINVKPGEAVSAGSIEGDDLEVVAVHEEGGGRPPLVLHQSGPGQDRGNHVELLVLQSYVLANLDLKYTKGHF